MSTLNLGNCLVYSSAINTRYINVFFVSRDEPTFLYANSVVHENKTTPSILTHILSFTDLSGSGICALSIQEMGALFGQATIEMFPQMT